MKNAKQYLARALGVLAVMAGVHVASIPSSAHTTDVQALMGSISNEASALHLAPSQIASSMTVISSGEVSATSFDITASTGTWTYAFSFYRPSASNIYLGSVAKRDASSNGVSFSYAPNGTTVTYSEFQTGKLHGVSFNFFNDGAPRLLVYAVTNAFYGETIQWTTGVVIELDYFDTNYIPIEKISWFRPP